MILIQKEIRLLGNPAKAKVLASFFKTGRGEYGEGDVFLGLTVPQSRNIAKEHTNLSFENIEKLLMSKYHEERLVGLLILVGQFQSGSDEVKKAVFDFYLTHLDFVNNWDLVDLSAYKIVGAYLFEQRKKIPQKLIFSKSLWERRVAMVATFAFLERGIASETFRVAKRLLFDREDLIHKAAGWMLREAGKRVSRDGLAKFLKKNKERMPRTMLRYAIERFPEKERKAWLVRKRNG